MHKPSLFLTLALLFFLLAYSIVQDPLMLTEETQIEELPENTLIQGTGTVIKETTYGKTTLLYLSSNHTLRCSCTGFLTKNISFTGTVDTYRAPLIQLKEIKVLP
jgi:hypothetical protein